MSFKHSVAAGKWLGVVGLEIAFWTAAGSGAPRRFRASEEIASPDNLRPPESGVAAPALPPQSKISRIHPAAAISQPYFFEKV
jgi:hypothetical protein